MVGNCHGVEVTTTPQPTARDGPDIKFAGYPTFVLFPNQTKTRFDTTIVRTWWHGKQQSDLENGPLIQKIWEKLFTDLFFSFIIGKDSNPQYSPLLTWRGSTRIAEDLQLTIRHLNQLLTGQQTANLNIFWSLNGRVVSCGPRLVYSLLYQPPVVAG